MGNYCGKVKLCCSHSLCHCTVLLARNRGSDGGSKNCIVLFFCGNAMCVVLQVLGLLVGFKIIRSETFTTKKTEPKAWAER
jgi:hypothetical protein